jgi:hypothetical protein
VGSRRAAALTVWGRPRKSAMMSSMFLENFTICLKMERKWQLYGLGESWHDRCYSLFQFFPIFQFLPCMGVGVIRQSRK